MHQWMSAARVVSTAILVAAATAVPLSERRFSPERFRAHVAFLSDDLLEGREAGTRGHDIAARYIAAQFELLGIEPGAADGTYWQRADLLETAQTGPEPRLRIATPRRTAIVEHGQDAVLQGATAGGRVRLKAPVVFVGYGMEDTSVGHNDYEGLDVRGKIVLVLWGFPRGMNSEVGAHLRREQLRFAARHGAVAMLAVPTRTTLSAVPWERLREFAREPLTTWVKADGTPYDPAHGLKATAIIEPRSAAVLMDGTGQDLDRILADADSDGVRPKGFALKAVAEIVVTSQPRAFATPNVIGVIEGSDPVLRREYVVLMGHADHIGVKPAGPGDRINNGALDNAAGVATLIEVGRALANDADRPRRSIMLVATSAEEKGLLGAEYFAANPPVPVERLVAVVNLDMPLLLYDFTDLVAFGAQHSTLSTVIERAGSAMGVTLSPDPMPEQGIFVRSDHYAMVKVGVPAVMLATGMANGGKALWGEFLAKRYHQPVDDLSQPIVWEAGAKFAEFNYRAVRALADNDTPPRWYEGDYFGDLFAPAAAKAPRP